MGEHLKRQRSIRLSDEVDKRLTKLAKRHGGIAKAIELGLAKLDGANDLTQEEVIAWIERNTK